MSDTFSPDDVKFMQLALELAAKGQYTTAPNPSVGCVLVKNGEIVGKGFHFKAGQPHAERVALADAGEKAKGATAYVTLEPCSHYGRTPPCALGLIEAGVSRVVAAMADPNPQVAGKGLKMLADAGIQSVVNLLNEQAEALNKGFLKRMRTGKPYVQLKLAMSLDGRTAMASGESKWITGEAARADVQKMRAKTTALLSTSATVLADDPSLNVRWNQFPDDLKAEYAEDTVRQPIRIILDSKNRVQSSHQLFHTHSPVWLVGSIPRDMSVFPDFCEQILLPENYDFDLLMTELGKRQVNSVWVEAGANLAGSLIEQHAVDELIIYVAPKLLGDNARGLCQLPHLEKLADAPLWQLQECERIGDDLKAEYAEDTVRQPIRVILDSKNRVQPSHQLFHTHSPVWLVGSIPRDMSVFPDFCEQILLPENYEFDLLMTELGKRQVNSVWVEAGANLAGSLIEQHAVDELIIYVSPKLLGDKARGLCQLPHLEKLADAPLWQLQECERIGDDLKLSYLPNLLIKE